MVTCPGRPGRLSALSVSPSTSVLYGAFAWAREVLNGQKRRFPARADNKNIPSATSTSVELYGTGAGIKAGLKTWSLDAANNLGPQP
jgi:hypothetical protein